jgi:hypothetical protein
VLKPGHGGFLTGIVFAAHSGVRSVRHGSDEIVAPEKLDGDAPVRTAFWGLAEVPLEITFDAAQTPPRVVVFELSPLSDSDEAHALIAARPADATPAYRGDSATVFTVIDLAAMKAP